MYWLIQLICVIFEIPTKLFSGSQCNEALIAALFLGFNSESMYNKYLTTIHHHDGNHHRIAYIKGTYFIKHKIIYIEIMSHHKDSYNKINKKINNKTKINRDETFLLLLNIYALRVQSIYYVYILYIHV